MFRRFSANFAVFSIFLDAVLVAVGLFFAGLIRVTVELPFIKQISEPVTIPLVLYLAFPGIWVGILLINSVYDGRRNFRVVDEFSALTISTLIAAVSMAGLIYLSYREISRFLFIIFIAITFIAMLTWRVLYRLAYRKNLFMRFPRRRVLILGKGSLGEKLLTQLQEQPDLSIGIIGFLDDDPLKREKDPDILGSLGDTRGVITENHVDDVIIALPRSAYVRMNKVVSELHDMPVRVWVILDYFSLTLHRASVEDFAGLPMIDLRAPALSEYQRITKRIFDLVITGLALPFVLPATAIISLAIRLDTPGRIFLRQQRMGENGRVFGMIKFRTMVNDAEKLAHLVEKVDEHGRLIHKTEDDPRVTRTGKFLRRTSLDELPQLLNVIKGEMSLVGPRPEMPYLVEKYQPWQRKRFVVPQGMTGWWQIHGRSDKPMHLHTEDDLYYVQHYSIWLDLQILITTVWVVIKGKGAY